MFQALEPESYIKTLEIFEENVRTHRFFLNIGNTDHPVLKFFGPVSQRPTMGEAIEILESQLQQLRAFRTEGETISHDGDSQKNKKREKINGFKIPKSATISTKSSKPIPKHRGSIGGTGARLGEFSLFQPRVITKVPETILSSNAEEVEEVSSESSLEAKEEESEIEAKIKRFQFFDSSSLRACKSIDFGFKV